jgi:hypothetical protein
MAFQSGCGPGWWMMEVEVMVSLVWEIPIFVDDVVRWGAEGEKIKNKNITTWVSVAGAYIWYFCQRLWRVCMPHVIQPRPAD